MKITLLLLLFLTSTVVAGEAPAWAKDIEGTQRTILRWIAFFSITMTSAAAAISALVMFCFKKLKEIQELKDQLRDSRK